MKLNVYQKHAQPMNFNRGHHWAVTVVGEGGRLLMDQPWRQTLQLSRPDQKSIVTKHWDHNLPTNTDLIWKSIEYSILKSEGKKDMLLRIRKEGVDVQVLEIQNDSKLELVYSTQDTLSWDSLFPNDPQSRTTRILGNEMYVAILMDGRLRILYFDPDMEIGPDHIQF
jgi:hypothetical protein